MIYKGNIVDTAGTPLPGAHILIAPGKGTITDFDGNFSFQVSNPNQVITFSYVGHEPQKFKARDIPKQITLVGESLPAVEIIAKKKKLPEAPPKKDYTLHYVVSFFLFSVAITGVIIYANREKPSVPPTDGNYKSNSNLKTTKINL